MKNVLFALFLILICSCKRAINNRCILIIDSNYIRENLSRINKFHNPKIDSLINAYENMPIQNLINIDEANLNVYKDNANLYSLSIPELNHPQWQFLLKKEVNKNDTLFTAKVYLVTKNNTTINDIFPIAYISNDQFPYKLSTCFSDSIITITSVISWGTDLVIDGSAKEGHDSLTRLYTTQNGNLVLKKEENIKKYIY